MRYALAVISLFYCYLGCSQTTSSLGLLPTFNINKSISARVKINLKTESRIGRSSNLNEAEQNDIQWLLTDVALLSSLKLGAGQFLAAGYLIRFKENRFIHRLIQQVTWVNQYSSFRLAHRLVGDQTLDRSTTFRLRYRIGAEIPFNGLSADAREFYLKMNNEYLNALEKGFYELEIRIIPVLGYSINDTNRIEWGLDYRWGDAFSNRASNQLWINLNWYMRI